MAGPPLTAGGQNQLSQPSSLKQERDIEEQPTWHQGFSTLLSADGELKFPQHVAKTTLRPDQVQRFFRALSLQGITRGKDEESYLGKHGGSKVSLKVVMD